MENTAKKLVNRLGEREREEESDRTGRENGWPRAERGVGTDSVLLAAADADGEVGRGEVEPAAAGEPDDDAASSPTSTARVAPHELTPRQAPRSPARDARGEPRGGGGEARLCCC